MKQYHDDQKNFGNNILLLRKLYGLSQKQMAGIMQVSVYCEQKAEKGIFANSLRAEALVNLSRYFRLRPSAFFGPAEQWGIAQEKHEKNSK